MNCTNILSFFILLFVAQATTAQDLWIQRDSVGGPGKCAVAAFAIGQRGYIGLGNSDNGFKRSLYEYNPIIDDWDKKESLGGPTGGGLERVSPSAFVVNGKAYVGLGNGNNPFYKDFWEYDPATDTWTQKADFGGTPRRQAVGFAIDSMGYVGTGIDANGYTSDFWKYSPTTNVWTAIAPFGGGNRKQAVGFAMGGNGYVGTGDNGSFSNDFWEYNPTTDTWTAKASFPGTPRYAATGIGAWPDAIVGLGYDNTLNYKADLYRYDAISDTWTQLLDFPGGARSNATGFIIERHAYIGCGYNANGIFVDDFYEYGTLINVDKIADVSNLNSAVYPNPMSNSCTVELEGIEGGTYSIQLFNTLGQDVTGSINVQQFDIQKPKFQLTANQISNGLYFYAINENGKKIKSGELTIAK